MSKGSDIVGEHLTELVPEMGDNDSSTTLTSSLLKHVNK